MSVGGRRVCGSGMGVTVLQLDTSVMSLTLFPGAENNSALPQLAPRSYFNYVKLFVNDIMRMFEPCSTTDPSITKRTQRQLTVFRPYLSLNFPQNGELSIMPKNTTVVMKACFHSDICQLHCMAGERMERIIISMLSAIQQRPVMRDRRI